jgi:hypothetical protein
MPDREQVSLALDRLREAYDTGFKPREITPGMLNTYSKALKSYSKESLERGVDLCIAGERYFPPVMVLIGYIPSAKTESSFDFSGEPRFNMDRLEGMKLVPKTEGEKKLAAKLGLDSENGYTMREWARRMGFGGKNRSGVHDSGENAQLEPISRESSLGEENEIGERMAGQSVPRTPDPSKTDQDANPGDSDDNLPL